jgi:hypothetical protein
LLFAAVRHVCGLPSDWAQFRRWFFERRDEVIEVMIARRTQTNEPARCATLLPLLAMLPGPLALIEVGAAAGLCLLIDRYGYAYGDHIVPARDLVVLSPLFHCSASAGTPLPAENIEIAWRAGLDLNPIDVHDPDQVAWLEALVWPGEGRRLDLLRMALEVARADPPPVAKGDLRTDLPTLAAQAPQGATLVVFHTAVLNYIADPTERSSFGDTIQSLGARWVANEGHGVLANPTRTANQPPWPEGLFLLSLDGQPIAHTDPHGTTIDWLQP